MDTNTELCTWQLEFTVDARLTAVSCGELAETYLSADKKTKTFKYKAGFTGIRPLFRLF